VLLNDRGDGTLFYKTFAGEVVDANSILAKTTLNGDADLNGQIDADDYFAIDRGFANRNNPASPFHSGWQNGDFDYNGKIDPDDYFLIDRCCALQPASPAAGAAAVAVPAVVEANPDTSPVPSPRSTLPLADCAAALSNRFPAKHRSRHHRSFDGRLSPRD